MTKPETSTEIDKLASEWVVREDSRLLTPEEALELDLWLDGDPRRRGAYMRAQAAWAMLDRGRALAGGIEPKRQLVILRRALIGGGAAIAAAAVGGYFWMEDQRHDRFRTAVGEIRIVPLRDGSNATINTASKIDVLLEKQRRLVRIEEGEAWFDVAKDAKRPFVVEAGDVSVRAVGTAFSVRKYEGGADLVVSEGVVEAWMKDAPKPTRVPAGSHVFIGLGGNAGSDALAAEEVSRALAWRQGLIGLNGETVFEAAEEFNRFNFRKIVVDDETLGKERIVGFFRATDPESFARAVVKSYGARVWMDDRTLRLTRSGAG